MSSHEIHPRIKCYNYDLVRDLPWGHLQLLHYFEGATGGINLNVNSSSPDSTPRSLNQTFCTTSPLTQLMLLSRTRQFSLSGMTFLNVVSPEETLKISLNLAAETNGCRLTKAFPILSSAFKRSLSNTSYKKKISNSVIQHEDLIISALNP